MDKEQIESLREQVIEQLRETVSPEKFEAVKEQIENLDDEQFIEFINKNNQQNTEGKCIFCSIVFGDTSSYKINENEKAIAVLEINPISKGHVLILPKEHGEVKTDETLASIVKEISDLIKEKFSPKEVKASYSQMLGHTIINLLPVYENETMNSEKKHASHEELVELQNTLSKKEEKKAEIKTPKPKKVKEKNLWLPRRIP